MIRQFTNLTYQTSGSSETTKSSCKKIITFTTNRRAKWNELDKLVIAKIGCACTMQLSVNFCGFHASAFVLLGLDTHNILIVVLRV